MVKTEDKPAAGQRPVTSVLLMIALTLSGTLTSAQDSLWTLQRCTSYAKTHNLAVQQSVLNERVAKMQWQQSRLAMLPNIMLSSSYGRSFGRSIDPTTNTFNSTNYDFTGLSGSAGVLLFGWLRQRNTAAKSNLLYQASRADLDQLQNDIALNVINTYLRVLLAKEQITICSRQLVVSGKQLAQTESLLSAGRSNGLDLSQIKTQLVTDSTNYFKAQLALQQALIDMKAVLNLELQAPFSVSAVDYPDAEQAILSIDPELICQQALSKSGSLQSAKLQMQGAEKQVSITKGSLYPQLNLSVSSGTNYSSTYQQTLPDGQVQRMPLGKQFHSNFSQSIYLGLSIPIFNGLSSRYALKHARTAVQIAKLATTELEQKLRQDIYKACNEAATAFQTYKAFQSAAATAAEGLDFAQKRYEKGLIPVIELLLAQNTSFKANADVASAKYELIFKLMVVDYYRGSHLFETR